MSQTAKLISKLHRQNKSSKLWNIIRKRTKQSQGGIGLPNLVEYFSNKFKDNRPSTEYIKHARESVNLKFIELNKEAKSNSWNRSLSVCEICYYVKKLKNNSTPGCDGITTEHLKYALDSKLPLHLCVLFSLCVRTGITPDKFNME